MQFLSSKPVKQNYVFFSKEIKRLLISMVNETKIAIENASNEDRFGFGGKNR